MIYAGFWVRFWAIMIDAVILLPALFVAILLNVFLFFGQLLAFPILLVMHGFVLISTGTLLLILHWLYFAGFESSRHQATPGKRAMGIYVTTATGWRPGFTRASVRYFAKIISSFWMVGFIMAAFTARKQALHDFVAETVVVRR